MGIKELQDKIDALDIQLRHVRNDYQLTRHEFEEATRNYLEVLSEFKEKNKELSALKENLEHMVEKRTKELRESQKILLVKGEEQQIMLDSSPAMIYYTDIEGEFVRINKSFSDAIGQPLKEVLGKSEKDIFPKQAESFQKDNNEIIKSGEPKHDILEQLVTPEGKRWILMDKIPYHDLDGNIIGIITFALDITDRKVLEEQLIHSEKLATVGRLVAGVAHELNNPLSIVLGYCQLLHGDNALNEEHQKKIGRIQEAALRCSAIVDNLLKFSRKSKLDRKNIQINSVLEKTLGLTEHAIHVANIKVEKEFSDDLPEITGDFNQLQSVFVNLINNAYDAINESDIDNKKGKIRIRSFTRDGNIIIRVSDNGPGIPDENKNSIFDPFFTSKEVGKGTGLGLSICYGIVKEHNGEIKLLEENKEGTEFEIVLPVRSEAFIATEEIRKKSLREDTKILIIEDEPEIVELQQMIFDSFPESFVVDTASNGEKGYKLIEKSDFSYDLVVSDVKMPGKYDGIELYKKTKKKNREQADRFVFVTGDLSSDTRKFLDGNNLRYVSKPFTIEDYQRIVEDRLHTE